MTVSPEENFTQLYKLAIQLLAAPFDPQIHQPQLLAGQLPSPLPFELPLPDSCEIIGSFVRNSENIQIILNTDQSPIELVHFYREHMQAAGWSEPDVFKKAHSSGRGFVHSIHRPSDSATFCKGSHGPSLHVFAIHQDKGERTNVRLHIDTRTRNSLCRQASEIFMGVGNLIPTLMPPPDGKQWSGGGGSHSESASTSAILDLPNSIALPDIAAYYANQLEQSGWQRIDNRHDIGMVWHTWTLQDEENEPWQGVFTLLRMPGMENQYYLQVLINWIGDK